MQNLVDLYNSFKVANELFPENLSFHKSNIKLVPGEFIAIGADRGNKKDLFLYYIIHKLFKDLQAYQLLIETRDSKLIAFDYLSAKLYKRSVQSSYNHQLLEKELNHPLLNSTQLLIHEHIGSWEQLKEELPTMVLKQQTNILIINSIENLFIEKHYLKGPKEQRYILEELKRMSLKYNFITVFTFQVLAKTRKKHPPKPEVNDIPKHLLLPSITYILLYHSGTYYYNYDIPEKKLSSLEFQLIHTTAKHSGSFKLKIDKSHSYLFNLETNEFWL